MRLQAGRAHGWLAWTLIAGIAIGFLGMGPRGHGLPFFGLFGEAPLGIPKLGWMAITVAFAASYFLLQLSRGEVASVDDDPLTTLDLTAPKEKGPGA